MRLFIEITFHIYVHNSVDIYDRDLSSRLDPGTNALFELKGVLFTVY